MKTIILDMYGVVIKAPEGDLILGMNTILFNRRNASYSGITVNSFQELSLYFNDIKCSN